MNRRRLLQTLALAPLSLDGKDFWEAKDPAAWTKEEKEALLWDSPWAREGTVRFDADKRSPTAGTYTRVAPSGADPTRAPGMATSVPIGEKPPPVPSAGTAKPLEFRVVARWESAGPIRLAGGPELPRETAGFYVVGLKGLPLMPPPKTKPGEVAPNPNESLLAAIKENSYIVRREKPALPCAHLLTGSGAAATEVLLFFARPADPIVVGEKTVTLESRFGPFALSVKFPLKEMMYKKTLAL